MKKTLFKRRELPKTKPITDAQRRKVHEAVDKLLDVRYLGHGGWPETVDKKDIDKMHELFYLIADTKVEPDYQGDNMIQILVVNKRRYYKLHFWPYDHPDFITTEEQLRAYLSTVQVNVGIAAEEVRRSGYIIEDFLKAQKEKLQEK